MPIFGAFFGAMAGFFQAPARTPRALQPHPVLHGYTHPAPANKNGEAPQGSLASTEGKEGRMEEVVDYRLV